MFVYKKKKQAEMYISIYNKILLSKIFLILQLTKDTIFCLNKQKEKPNESNKIKCVLCHNNIKTILYLKRNLTINDIKTLVYKKLDIDEKFDDNKSNLTKSAENASTYINQKTQVKVLDASNEKNSDLNLEKNETIKSL